MSNKNKQHTGTFDKYNKMEKLKELFERRAEK
jgi:hypothetical protein